MVEKRKNNSLQNKPTHVYAQIQSYCKVTSPDTEGPYWMNGVPVRNVTLCDYSNELTGPKLTVSGRVTDETCSKGIFSQVDVWQADEKGKYSDGIFDYKCRTRIFTDPQGYFKYTTFFPAKYMQAGGYRPAHIHYKVEPVVEGGYGTFITQMYFKNDTSLGAKDSCGVGCNSGDPTRQTEPHLTSDGRALEVTFNIVLRKMWR